MSRPVEPAADAPRPDAPRGRQFQLATLFAAMALAAAIFLGVRTLLHEPPKLDWQPYTPELLEKHVRAGRPVVVNFQASWDFVSVFNQRRTWEDRKLVAELRRKDVVCLVADFSAENPYGEELMDALGLNIVPAAAIYRDGSLTPKLLRERIVAKDVLEALP